MVRLVPARGDEDQMTSGYVPYSDLVQCPFLRRCRGRSGHRGFMSTRPNTTLAESVYAGVFQGFVFGNMDTAATVAEG